ncbi:hypothetical protein K466DRAFT_484038 [Polyporus arcularius HHB13444]|uniref:GATA-type domain-containing protein n=1 Tax=Polyporus arcularius HHB13444 TaxID=1314778 RepID=A0A5C3PSQ4_9APHY|nr:hypothetical protein K466DRAFT_484038 [Polyporus arcularius HHB13444]
MAPVVLESPVMNMHNNALSTMSRLQFNSHIHTPPASDHSRNDEDASPERSGDNVDGAADQNNPPANSELACTNCGTVNTPQWRRGDDGKSICNACGESLFHSRYRFRYLRHG